MQLARKALEARGALFEEYKSVLNDSALSEGERAERAKRLDAAIVEKTDEVKDFTARAEAEAEARKIDGKLGTLFKGGSDGSWGSEKRFSLPSGSEYRDLTTGPASGGVTISPAVHKGFLTSLRKKAAFLGAGVNVAEMESGTLRLPTVTDDGTATIVAEGTAIPLTDMTVSDSGFQAYTVAKLTAVTNELLADSEIDIRKGVEERLVAAVAATVDDYFLNGTGTGQPLGVLNIPGVNKRALSAAVTLDDIADEMYQIESFGGTVGSILVDPKTFNVIRKLKASTAGTYHSSPFAGTDGPRQVWGANLISAPRLAAGNVILMDPSQVWTGLRQDVSLAYDESVYFAQNKVAIRLTSRWAGVGLTDVKAVRVLTGAAP
ncbi:phage major capsid protein [Streptomyces sp. AS58]|uniref:phage major capsid protein n=1 Tax=Streptomyces sp. AS58 TaxID=1519489 RepID=UPI00131D4884|nr:phage major capsid protein [Streptomyces sp. AS58]